MNIKEAMLQRKSMRTYKDEQLSKELREKLDQFILSAKGPFDVKVRFKIVDTDSSSEDMKLGTYGVIKGARSFICAVTEKGDRCEENMGYAFEKIVLYATSLGLGTCWLGGTFNKTGFQRAAKLGNSELMPVISPVGHTREKRALLDTLMVAFAGSKNRKNWSELFFDKNFGKTLSEDGAGDLKEAFEMARLAPSASNKQPWRIVKDDNTYHFFVSRSKMYEKALGFDIQRLDIGIAMCHFESMAKELGYSGKWVDKNPGLAAEKNVEYVVSFAADKNQN
jgi:nitroreductase